MPRNFIPGPNPFGLAGPPASFLSMLRAYDSELVLFASQEQPCYQVARRLTHTRASKPSERHPDTRVFAVHNLHPVARLLPSPFTQWGPTIIEDLKARDVDAHGGGDKAADILDQFDVQHEQSWRRETEELADYRAKDAWDYITKKHHDQAKKSRSSRSSRSVPTIGRLNFKAGGSAVFVGERHIGRKPKPKIVADITL